MKLDAVENSYINSILLLTAVTVYDKIQPSYLVKNYVVFSTKVERCFIPFQN